MIRRIVLSVAVLATFPAWAASNTKQVPKYTSVTPTQSTTIYADRPSLDPGVWDPVGAGAVRVRDTATLTLPSGTQAPITASRTVTNAAVKTAAKTIAKNLIPGLNIAITVYDLLNPQGVEADPNGGWVIDPGLDPAPTGGLMRDVYTGTNMLPSAILARQVATTIPLHTSTSVDQYGNVTNWVATATSATSSCSGGRCRYAYVIRVTRNGSFQYHISGSDEQPEVIDLACPPTTSTIMVRGTRLCQSDLRVRPSDDVIEEIIDDLGPDTIPTVAKEFSRALPGGLPTDGTAPELAGPPVVSDPPSVTTKPDGTTETKQRHWDMEYPGDGTIRYTPRLVEVTPAGETVTTGEDAAPEGTTNTPDKAECEKTPDVIGCSKYGTPDGDEVQKRTENVSFEKVNLGGGSCPPDRSFDAFGKSYAVSWSPICDATITYVKPTILLIFGGMAVFIFIGGLKS